MYRIGDEVVVLDFIDEDDRWRRHRDIWVDDMDRTIGLQGIVNYTEENRCNIELENGACWWYREEWLALVEEPEIAPIEDISELFM